MTCTDFGGEGTGRKSQFDSTGLPIIGEEYFMVISARSIPLNRIHYSGYFFDPVADGGWRLLSRIEVNRGQQEWSLHGLYAFVEQWVEGNTLKPRGAVFGPSFMWLDPEIHLGSVDIAHE